LQRGVPERPQIVQDAKVDPGRLVPGRQLTDGFRRAESPDRYGGDERVQYLSPRWSHPTI
jgi:hypothetical protein